MTKSDSTRIQSSQVKTIDSICFSCHAHRVMDRLKAAVICRPGVLQHEHSLLVIGKIRRSVPRKADQVVLVIMAVDLRATDLVMGAGGGAGGGGEGGV